MASSDIERAQSIVRFADASIGAQDRVTAAKLQREKGPSTKASTGSWVDWSNQAEFLGQPFDVTHIPLSKLEQMRRDPMLAFGLMFCKMPMIRASWRIQSSDPRRAAAVDGALRRIYGRLVLAWTNCFDFGYSAMTKRFENYVPDWTYIDKDDPDTKETPVWDNGGLSMLTWKPFVALNPKLVTPNWDSSGGFNGIHYGGARSFSDVFGDKNPDIPLTHSLWATNEQDSVFGSMWGYPKIGYAYRYWWAYWYRFGLADRAFEKWADPPVIAHHPVEAGLDADGNKVDYGSEALALAEKLRSGANIAMPTSVVTAMDEKPTNVREWELEQMENKVNFAALNETFEYLDIQKLRAVAVPEHALVEGKGGSSSRNVAGEHGDIFMQSQAVALAQLDDDINRYLIPQFLEVNFGPGAPCTKVTTGFDPQDVETMRALVQAIANSDPSKVPVDMEELLERMGIPVLSRASIQAELEKQAEAAAQLAPPEFEGAPSDLGQEQAAGVSDTGLYYAPREVIRLSEDSGISLKPELEVAKRAPFVIERVDHMPEGIPEQSIAYFDQATNTLYVSKDADPGVVSDYMLQLSQRSGGDVSVVADDGDPILLELAERLGSIESKVDEATRAKPTVHVHVPESKPGRRIVKKHVVRDGDGNIADIIEESEEVK